MLQYFVLILAVPLGFYLSHLTKDEKKIYAKAPYFPVFLWVFAIAAAIFYSLNETIALTLTFIFLTVFVWYKR